MVYLLREFMLFYLYPECLILQSHHTYLIDILLIPRMSHSTVLQYISNWVLESWHKMKFVCIYFDVSSTHWMSPSGFLFLLWHSNWRFKVHQGKNIWWTKVWTQRVERWEGKERQECLQCHSCSSWPVSNAGR